jgi:hypothetical protein
MPRSQPPQLRALLILTFAPADSFAPTDAPDAPTDCPTFSTHSVRAYWLPHVRAYWSYAFAY